MKLRTIAFVLLILILCLFIFSHKKETTVELTDKALFNFYKCIEDKHREDLCQKENEQAYQLLSELDVEEKIGQEIQEERDFKRVSQRCAATKKCETYSCLNKNLWRCHD